MSVKKILSIFGLCVLFVGCSTNKYYGDNSLTYSDNSPKSMGVRYLLGRGVKQDNEKAFYYFRKAANQNDAFAQNELAYMYAAGKGTPREDAKAFKWYKAAANHGLISAQYNLALLYLHGIGTKADKKLALEWLQKSAQGGFEPAHIKLNQLNK